NRRYRPTVPHGHHEPSETERPDTADFFAVVGANKLQVTPCVSWQHEVGEAQYQTAGAWVGVLEGLLGEVVSVLLKTFRYRVRVVLRMHRCHANRHCSEHGDRDTAQSTEHHDAFPGCFHVERQTRGITIRLHHIDVRSTSAFAGPNG